ncbi:MAG: response regulator, partial [Actinomycetota bacterium]
MYDALGWAERLAFAGLALVSLRLWWRQRSRAAGWAAATFCILGSLSLIGGLVGFAEDPPALYLKSILIALFLAPLSLHRFMNAMVRPPRWVSLGGLALTGLVVGATLFLPELPPRGAPRPAWLQAYLVLVLAQWTGLSLSTSVRMLLAGRRQPGLPRRRMRLLACAALGLNLVIVMSGMRGGSQSAFPISALGQLIGLASAGLLYLALAPPRFVRLAWRREEQQALQRAAKGVSAATSVQEVSDALLPHVAPIFGGHGAVLADPEGHPIGIYGMDAAEAAALLTAGPAGAGPNAPAGFVDLPMRSGRLVIKMSAFTPIFGRTELEELSGIGEYVDLALDRVSLFESERRGRAELERANEELRIARDEALAASQLKSAFLANMSHEIRTPMNAVIGMTSVLLDSGLDAAQREYAGMVRTAGESLLEIINGILDLSKIEAGRLTLESMEFDLRLVFEEVVELLAKRATDKGLELTALVDAAVPGRLRGDPGRLRQVLVNLVGNAVKFTPAGEIALRATPEEPATDRAVLRFEVRDTGIGIPADVQQHLFEPFYQVDSSDTRTHGGTGLGLAISRQLVDLMGGGLRVESDVGAGSCFSFDAAFGVGVEEAPALLHAWVDRGTTALVVDDNATSRSMLEEHLTLWGFTAASAGDGGSALAMLRLAAAAGTPYGLLLVDAAMPGMDGIALAGEVRADPALEGTRLVLMTDRLDDDAVTARLALDGVVAKPVRPSRLFDCLSVLFGAADASPLPQEPAMRIPPAPAPGTRVLLVEDNSVNQKVATMILDKLGYRSDVAADGVEALRAVFLVPYAAVLMDCQMPRMDGYEATAAIRRAEPAGTHLPIIAMTASAMEGDRKRCLDAGMDDYIA